MCIQRTYVFFLQKVIKHILQLTNIQFYSTQIDILCVENEKRNDTVRHYSYIYIYMNIKENN